MASLGTTIFSDNFESGTFKQWSYIQADDPNYGPGSQYNFVGTQSKTGVPAHAGSYVAQFERPEWATSTPHAKVFKEWSNVGKRDEFGRVEETLPDNGNPSGSYKAWFYLPSDYQVTSKEWMNIFQFKEEGYINGTWHQDPNWWLNVSSASTWGAGGSEPVIFANHWKNTWDYKPSIMKLPLGRWFEVKADLFENNRIDWYVDGRKLDTSYDSEYNVGRFYDKSNGWVFGVGHYQGTGKLWVDDVSVNTHGTETAPAPTTTATNATKVVVNASGTAAGGVNAHFNLLVDGKKIGEGVATTTAKDFTFNTSVSADQAHKVQVQYDNDVVLNGVDRNLYVNKVTINGKAVLPTASNVTYDKFALDGKDVIAGQSMMKWNGTLIVNADKAYFPATPTAAAAQAPADAAELWFQLNRHAADTTHPTAAVEHPNADAHATLPDMTVLPDFLHDTSVQHGLH